MRLSAATWQKGPTFITVLIHVGSYMLARRPKVISNTSKLLLCIAGFHIVGRGPLFCNPQFAYWLLRCTGQLLDIPDDFFCHPRTIAKLPFMSIPSILLRWLRWWRGMLAICTWSALLSFDLVREEEEAANAWHSLFLSCCHCNLAQHHASSIHIWNCA